MIRKPHCGASQKIEPQLFNDRLIARSFQPVFKASRAISLVRTPVISDKLLVGSLNSMRGFYPEGRLVGTLIFEKSANFSSECRRIQL
jgi:hypothetical protein